MSKNKALTLDEKVGFAKSKLGPTLVAAALGFRQREIISENSQNFQELLSKEQEIRLDHFIYAWNKISDFESDEIAGAWFLGANPWMRDDSAIQVIREDRFSELKTAVKAFLEDAWNL